MNTDKRPIQADDLYRYELLTEPQISPDGRHVVFGVQRVERKEVVLQSVSVGGA